MLQAISLILKNEKLHSALSVILVCQYTIFSSYFVAFLCGRLETFLEEECTHNTAPKTNLYNSLQKKVQ